MIKVGIRSTSVAKNQVLLKKSGKKVSLNSLIVKGEIGHQMAGSLFL